MSHLELLKKNGLKATHQRLLVLQILAKHTHPTIDELYEVIKKDYPSISLATVYKNLNTLLDCGLICKLNIANNKTKFDINEEPHIHLVCDNCGEVYDHYKETSSIGEYHEKLEKSLGEKINTINVIAHMDKCKKCKD